jgi:hypothetical protein
MKCVVCGDPVPVPPNLIVLKPDELVCNQCVFSYFPEEIVEEHDCFMDMGLVDQIVSEVEAMSHLDNN